MLYNTAMKITKLDNRHNAKRKYGFNYSAKVKPRDFYILISPLVNMFGKGGNMRWFYRNPEYKWAYWEKEHTFYFKEDSEITIVSLIVS